MSRPVRSPAEVSFGVEIGQRLKDLREHRRVSANTLSSQCGVSVDTIRSIESGRVGSPGLYVVTRLLAALDGSLDDLVEHALSTGPHEKD